MRYNHHQYLHQNLKFEKPKRNVGALIDVDYNKDDVDDDDNGNFVKIGNDDYKGNNDN